MTNLKMMFLCSRVNLRKWAVNTRIYTLAVLIIAFLAYHSYGLSQFAAEKGVAITPWVFPHLNTPPVMQVFACFTLLLFCDAPFADRHMPFLVIRTGRRNWAIGQFIYIILAAFIYTAFVYAVSVLVLVPNIQFSTDWGIVIKTLAVNSDMAPDVTIFMNEEIIYMLSPIKATLISFGLFWLVAVFVGVLIFCFNTVIGKMSGVVITGIFIFISYFSMYLGFLSFGIGIYYFSPISWSSITFVDWDYSGTFPSPTYAVLFLLLASLLMSILSTIVFCKKDMNIQNWGY
ncbi:hypothetical protein MUB24_03855 [Lederbergia sp. NSJ-179]|uniref:hypothetical protein n=1 Tax=Lederbergia sp. NSJ-179 TaxID=2931402 RepID=UPI001FD2A3EB|nr:hypothetical protein [Lederbergia sp. NSJ-179]MCJ7840059.1 hypothetical protein [Lederbergia sp. NSJ-179]